MVGVRRPRWSTGGCSHGCWPAASTSARVPLVRASSGSPPTIFASPRTVFGCTVLLLSLGLPVGRTAVAIVVTLGAMALARTRSWTQREFLCLAIAAVVSGDARAVAAHHAARAAGPGPCAGARAAARWRPGSNASGAALSAAERRRRVYEVILVVCCALTVQWSDGVGGLDPNPSLGLAAALLPRAVDPTAGVVRGAPAARLDRERSSPRSGIAEPSGSIRAP